MTEAEQRAQMEEMMRRHMAQQQAEQMEAIRLQSQAQYWTQKVQEEINTTKRRVKYAAIVAVDQKGAFAKDGSIPWHYPADFQWFQAKTANSICVMGRATYDYINEKLGDKAVESVLPGRKCFVVTSSQLPRGNATAVGSLAEMEKLLSWEEIDTKTVFICGGERLYTEAIVMCDELYITAVDKLVEGDRFFPIEYAMKHFTTTQVYKNDGAPDLRFTIWKRT